MTTTPPRIDPRLGAAALRAPAASREDSRPQAILKLQPRNSFDYRVRYEPQLDAPILYGRLKRFDFINGVYSCHWPKSCSSVAYFAELARFLTRNKESHLALPLTTWPQ